jgi:hypothetical protein
VAQEIITFSVNSTRYDGDYTPGQHTRATTNYANLARDPSTRRGNILTLLEMVNRDLNLFLVDDGSARYEISLDILSITGHFGDRSDDGVPLTEVMRAQVIDRDSGEIHIGPTGLNFSSYVRDYDFRVVLPKMRSQTAATRDIGNFGAVHGLLTRLQFGENRVVPDWPTVAISIGRDIAYCATEFTHPILGREYTASQVSTTDAYFSHMGLRPRFFKPSNLAAPLAIYSHRPDSLCDRSDVFLASLIAVMGNFQKIYRPEIYLRRTSFSEKPGVASRASLLDSDFERPVIYYDRDERELLADLQAQEVEERLFKRHPNLIARLNSCLIPDVPRVESVFD